MELKNQPFSCHVDSCGQRFVSRKELFSHLTSQHNIHQLRIDETSWCYQTSKKSEVNISIAESAEEWIKSERSISHLKEVMSGRFFSRRHKLFLDWRERRKAGSRLQQLSNTGFLGGGLDGIIINWLEENVYNVYFEEVRDNRLGNVFNIWFQSDPALRSLGQQSTAFKYTVYVLLPEAFIHQHQVRSALAMVHAPYYLVTLGEGQDQGRGRAGLHGGRY